MVNFSNGVIELLALYSKVHNLYIAVIYRQPDDLVGNSRSTEKEFQPTLNWSLDAVGIAKPFLSFGRLEAAARREALEKASQPSSELRRQLQEAIVANEAWLVDASFL